MNDFSNITAVTFDVGGTLIRPEPSVGHVYAAVALRHGLTVSPTRLNQQFARAWGELKDFHHGYDEWAALVDRAFSGLIDAPPSQTFFPEIYERFKAPDAWHVFKDVVPALDGLASRGLNLGIVSNWDDRLGPLLESLDLAKYFQAIVISGDVGFTKPSPVIFEHASKNLGTPPGNILHVGDSQSHDVAGAKVAGFSALQIKRNGVAGAADAIASLLEIEAMLE